MYDIALAQRCFYSGNYHDLSDVGSLCGGVTVSGSAIYLPRASFRLHLDGAVLVYWYLLVAICVTCYQVRSLQTRVQVGTGFIVGSQRDGNAMCRDTLAGLPGLSFLPVPPSRYPGQSKCAGTFFAGNGTCRDRLRRYPVQQNVPVRFRRERNMPEIDANEVNQLASLDGRTVGFASSSEGDGCTRTRHRHLGRRGPCTTFSTGVPIRSARCSAGPHTLGGVGRWLVLVCTAAVHPMKDGWFCRKGTRPEQKK